MEKRKTPKRPKKPAALYTQELAVKGVLLSVRLDQSMVENVNHCTDLTKEFITKIYDVYSAYSNRLKAIPDQEDNRWKHMEKCLELVGKPAQATKSSDFADLLGINKNMISDANLLRDERRASVDGVCHVLLGLGLIKSGNPSSEPKENKASARKDAIREPRNLFISYAKQRGAKRSEAICAAAMPFGYWLPEKADDTERDTLFENAIEDANKLAQKNDTGNVPNAQKDVPFIPQTLTQYVWLSRQKIHTLRNPQGAWSDNANKLHMIIASCSNTADEKAIEQAYHAFGLHPQGLRDVKKRDLPMQKKPDFPADQVVCVAIAYFRPLIACVKPIDFTSKMSVFWGLLYAQLNHYDEGVFFSTKLGLRDELFFNEKKTDEHSGPGAENEHYNELDGYAMFFEDIKFTPSKADLEGKYDEDR